MIIKGIAVVLSGLVGLGIIAIGVRFLLLPRAAAAGYGVAINEEIGEAGAYLSAKGVRDIVSGLVVFTMGGKLGHFPSGLSAAVLEILVDEPLDFAGWRCRVAATAALKSRPRDPVCRSTSPLPQNCPPITRQPKARNGTCSPRTCVTLSNI